jgi:hypothetical protein
MSHDGSTGAGATRHHPAVTRSDYRRRHPAGSANPRGDAGASSGALSAQGPYGDQRMDVLEVFARPPMRLQSCGLVEGVAGTVSTMSLTIRLGGPAAVRVPARRTHAAGIAVVIRVTHAATWAAMGFLCAGVPACFGAPSHSVAHRLSAWHTRRPTASRRWRLRRRRRPVSRPPGGREQPTQRRSSMPAGS